MWVMESFLSHQSSSSKISDLLLLSDSCSIPGSFFYFSQVHTAKTSYLKSEPYFAVTEPTVPISSTLHCSLNSNFYSFFFLLDCVLFLFTAINFLKLSMPQVVYAPSSNLLFLINYTISNLILTFQNYMANKHKWVMIKSQVTFLWVKCLSFSAWSL